MKNHEAEGASVGAENAVNIAQNNTEEAAGTSFLTPYTREESALGAIIDSAILGDEESFAVNLHTTLGQVADSLELIVMMPEDADPEPYQVQRIRSAQQLLASVIRVCGDAALQLGDSRLLRSGRLTQ